MNTRYMAPLLGLGILLTLVSCSVEEGPTGIAPDQGIEIPEGESIKNTPPEVTINNFVIRFDGLTMVDGNSVFTWTVRGSGVEPALSHFMIQLPECAPEPLSFTPTNSVSINTNPNTGIYGVEWHLNVEADDTVGRQYSITFPGVVPEGEVYSSVSSGNETSVGIIPGPCQGYDIGGRIFVDANENGQRDPDEESGIANVVIEMMDAAGNISTRVTDQFGDYSFRKLSGTFTVSLPLVGYPGFFNEGLATSFDATTALSSVATVPPESPDNDFGFAPQSDEIILELETGVLLSDGKSLRFWKSEFRAATHNGGGNSTYDAATLLGFLVEVEGLFLMDPYTFTPGNELQEAFDILRSNSNADVDELLAELLATELNQVSGRGILGQEELQLVLISWGEALVAEAWAGAQNKARPDPTELEDATRLFGLVNTGGGGGVDE